MSEVPPVLLSSIVCDRVIFDRITGMPSIINIVQNISYQRFPARHPSLVFFCELTNGHGLSNLSVRIVEVGNDEKMIFEQSGQVEFKNVKQVVTLALNMQGIVFPGSGEYRFQLFAANGQLLGERKVICSTVPTNNEEGK